MASVERIYDAIVVGAGVEGSATAYSLAKQGKDVLLLEQVRDCGRDRALQKLMRTVYRTNELFY